MARPEKMLDVLKKARACIEARRYYDTTHAQQRKHQRAVSLAEILYVLRSGYHEKRKDQYHLEHDDWTYAIRGKTVDGRDLRVAIAFDEEDMLIITVVDLARGT